MPLLLLEYLSDSFVKLCPMAQLRLEAVFSLCCICFQDEQRSYDTVERQCKSCCRTCQKDQHAERNVRMLVLLSNVSMPPSWRGRFSLDH